MEALKAAIQKEVRDAITEVADRSLQDVHQNVDSFYMFGGGQYQRTGQLAESPEVRLSGGGDNYNLQISLDTGFRYNPSGRDTMTIYNYAESGGLRGQGGFWAKTKEDVEKNINEAFSKRFE
ncbi:MAG: hypothetical protein V8Q58_07780 [Anaerobutyricum hallii]|uniref:hypothetical protein n=1 Tax=Anaerobutyricum hallii TaxID=39488 RepID=UPI00300F737B